MHALNVNSGCFLWIVDAIFGVAGVIGVSGFPLRWPAAGRALFAAGFQL